MTSTSFERVRKQGRIEVEAVEREQQVNKQNIAEANKVETQLAKLRDEARVYRGPLGTIDKQMKYNPGELQQRRREFIKSKSDYIKQKNREIAEVQRNRLSFIKYGKELKTYKSQVKQETERRVKNLTYNYEEYKRARDEYRKKNNIFPGKPRQQVKPINLISTNNLTKGMFTLPKSQTTVLFPKAKAKQPKKFDVLFGRKN